MSENENKNKNDLMTHDFVCGYCRQQNLARRLELDELVHRVPGDQQYVKRRGTCGWCQHPYYDVVPIPRLP